MPHHVVVDGSNIATEGRSMPSLAQLNEAVLAFIAEHPDALITVVVDATFGHRIDSKEVKEFDEAIANNELVAPPAGAVGRGDAFVLSIANKVGATILTNDSFQEFHGQYPWLFDEGRLIGGKPVPHIGWVFVPRIPVRGPVSRSAVKEAKRKKAGGAGGAGGDKRGTARIGSPEASQPMPVPKAPPPGARSGRQGNVPKPVADVAAAAAVAAAPAHAASAAPKAGQPVNDLLPFLSFVEHHPLGTSVNAVVENYSSHGAYVRVGDVKGYVPLRLMADPAPRSAREFMKIGDAITLVVESFAPARRSIDLAVVGMGTAKLPAEAPTAETAPKAKKAAKASRSSKKAAEPTLDLVVPDAVDEPTPAPAPGKKRGAKKAAAAAPVVAAPAVAPEPAAVPAKKRGAKKAAAAAPVVAAPAVAPEPAPAPAKKRGAKKAAPAPAVAEPVVTPEPAAPPAKKRGAKKAAAAEPAPAPAKKRAAKKS